MSETLRMFLYGALFLAGLPLLIVAIVSYVLHYFVALTSPPGKRAAWTAGIASLVTAVLLIASVESSVDAGNAWYGFFAPLLALPAGLIAYWFWRADFRRDWMDDSQPLPEGVELANDDWRVGVIFVVGVIVILAIKAAARLTLQP